MLLSTKCASVLEGIWIDKSFYFPTLLKHNFVSCAKISLFESILSGSMAEHDMSLNTSLWMSRHFRVVLERLLFKNHFLCFWKVVISGGRSTEIKLGSGLRNTSIASFLKRKYEL